MLAQPDIAKTVIKVSKYRIQVFNDRDQNHSKLDPSKIGQRNVSSCEAAAAAQKICNLAATGSDRDLIVTVTVYNGQHHSPVILCNDLRDSQSHLRVCV